MELVFRHEREAETPFEDEFLRDIAERTLLLAPVPGLQEKRIALSAAAVSRERIQELNSTYRSRDAVTDILSFHEQDSMLGGIALPAGELHLGDLVYCPSFILDAAQEDGIPDFHEMAYIFSHGVLHLLGYDHEDEMFALQDQVTASVVHAMVKGQ